VAMTQAKFEANLREALNTKGWDASRADTVEILEIVASEVFDALVSDGAVVVRGLGRWKVDARPARMGRNPGTGETIKIAASRKLKVLPPKAMKDELTRVLPKERGKVLVVK
jgi:DNA-binding protein HU-beta